MWTMVAADPGEYNNYEFRDHGFCFAMSIQVHAYMYTNLGTHRSSFLAFDMDLSRKRGTHKKKLALKSFQLVIERTHSVKIASLYL